MERTSSSRPPVVVTLTLNPALDISTSVELVEPWRKLRCDDARLDPGGGGINVAQVVKELGGEPIAVAALGGHVGSLIGDSLAELGIDIRRVPIRGTTRQDFSVSERATGRQYRFVQVGPRLTLRNWARCLAVTLDAARGARCVVASGSLPPGLPDDAFAELARQLSPSGIPLIVDTSGAALAAAAEAPVHLLKPSVNELSRISGDGEPLVRRLDIEAAARTLIARGGCQVVVVSMGAQGAMVVPRGQPSFTLHPPAVPVVSSIGAGDSMVAGLALAISNGDSTRDAVAFGVACGTAAVLSQGTGLCTRDAVDKILPQVTTE